MEENDGTQTPPCQFPKRIFTVGEKPTGVRVTPYHKACGIKQIINALSALFADGSMVKPSAAASPATIFRHASPVKLPAPLRIR